MRHLLTFFWVSIVHRLGVVTCNKSVIYFTLFYGVPRFNPLCNSNNEPVRWRKCWLSWEWEGTDRASRLADWLIACGYDSKIVVTETLYNIQNFKTEIFLKNLGYIKWVLLLLQVRNNFLFRGSFEYLSLPLGIIMLRI